MPSPLAHVGVTLALHHALGGRWDRTALAVAAASLAPDGDMVLAAAWGMQWHHGPTHSLVGSAALAAAIGLLAGTAGWRMWLATLVAGASHVAMDWSSGRPGVPATYGVPWLWPLSSARSIDADPWFGAFGIDEPGFLLHMLVGEAWRVYLRELQAVALAWAVALVFVRATRR
jgi:membrane-bound metal-dependent hydrolase YbcI (DUF457 family)